MISPELIRRFTFFGMLSDTQQKQIAMISEEVTIDEGTVVFEIGEPADWMYLLQEGTVDLHYIVVDEFRPGLEKDFLVGVINPGEVFCISALIEPYIVTATAIAVRPCKAIKTDARALRELCDQDAELSCKLMSKIAKAAMERLYFTRVELAAARA